MDFLFYFGLSVGGVLIGLVVLFLLCDLFFMGGRSLIAQFCVDFCDFFICDYPTAVDFVRSEALDLWEWISPF